MGVGEGKEIDRKKIDKKKGNKGVIKYVIFTSVAVVLMTSSEP